MVVTGLFAYPPSSASHPAGVFCRWLYGPKSLKMAYCHAAHIATAAADGIPGKYTVACSNHSLVGKYGLRVQMVKVKGYPAGCGRLSCGSRREIPRWDISPQGQKTWI
ncbi:hypothetical protein BD410DRAFT_262725 [Rickenella mellea]|uniref:Uncharacterized protein n=1 Tax=Rickenella mellea TaxID=50990 RepID=A0A4Y7Q476_9AGAM|nr:hypothetical protein BD410DRAFT_262725 [Rickenella mellea]